MLVNAESPGQSSSDYGRGETWREMQFMAEIHNMNNHASAGIRTTMESAH